MTADLLTSFNAMYCLCQLQQDGPGLLAGEAQGGGGGHGAQSDGGRHQSDLSKKKGSC